MEGKTARGHPSREAGRQRTSFEVRSSKGLGKARGLGGRGGARDQPGRRSRQAGGNASAPPSCEVPPSLLGKGCSGFTPGRAAAQRAKERGAGQVDCQPRARFFAWRKLTRGCLHPLLCRFSALPSRLWRFAMPFPSDRLSLALLLAVVTRPGLAAPVSTCDANGSLYFVGEWYSLDSDHCIQCECAAEGPACARTDCAALPPACIHVSHYPSDCCPRCERIGCEHRGQVYELGQHFQPSECEQCTCDLDGIARCLVADCAPPPCVNPIYEKGHCCPICKEGPNCYVDESQHNIIPAGDSIWVGPCIRCRCHDGQDAGYWEGNHLAKCEQLVGCRVSDRHHS